MRQVHISHELSQKNWRDFYNAYYISDRRFRLRFLYGTLTWIIGALGLLGLFDNKPVAFGMIAFGLYCVFIKQYLINRAIKKLKAGPQFPGAIDYAMDQEKISGTDRGAAFEFRWDQLHGYREVAPGLLLYLKQATFFFIPIEAFSDDQKKNLLAILTEAGVPDLNRR